MTEPNDNSQDPVQSHESSPDSAALTKTDPQPESPILGCANEPPTYQIVSGVPVIGEAHAPPPGQAVRNLSHNQSRMEIHDFQCSSFSFVKPTTYQQYRHEYRNYDTEKDKRDRELHEVERVLKSFRVSEEEFQAALAEYAAIKHELLMLHLHFLCVRRAWRFVVDERNRLLRLGDFE